MEAMEEAVCDVAEVVVVFVVVEVFVVVSL